MEGKMEVVLTRWIAGRMVQITSALQERGDGPVRIIEIQGTEIGSLCVDESQFYALAQTVGDFMKLGVLSGTAHVPARMGRF